MSSALNCQAWGPMFKIIRQLHVWFNLSSFCGRESEYQELVETWFLKLPHILQSYLMFTPQDF